MRWWATAAGAVAVSAGDVTAQSAQPISLQVSGLYASLFGDDYEGIGKGLGGEAQLRFTPGALSVGVGGQYTRHDFTVTVPSVGDFDGNLSLAGAFIEPRFVIATGSNLVAPYISARLSLLHQGISVDFPACGEVSGSATGTTVNGGGGLLVRLTSRMNLDAGATYGYTQFGEATIKCESTGEELGELAKGSGTNIVVRIGLAIGLGG